MTCGVIPTGMGDKKKTYKPQYAPIRDDVNGMEFAQCCMRECPEPHVIARWGIGGVCNVSVYTCRKCKYKVSTPFCGALGCSYESGLEQGLQSGKKN